MTEKKVLVLNDSNGDSEEHDVSSDTFTLAGLTMGGDIVTNGNEVTGLPDVPSVNSAAASKKYVDDTASAGGGDTAKVSADDTTAGYLNGKLVAGSGISLTELTPGGNETLSIAATGAAAGDVVGPASATDGNVAKFDGATGKLIKDSGVSLSGSNTGDQSSIVGISGTVSEFNTAITDATLSGNNTGDQTITLTGEVTGSGTGSFAATVADNVIDEANLKLDTSPTNDHVLTADSTQPGGMKWAAAGATLTNNANAYYVGKHGDSGNSGLTWNDAFDTFTDALTAIDIDESPAYDNQFVINCYDAGIYAESVTLPSFVHINAPAATINGNHLIGDYSNFILASNTISSNIAFTKTGTGSSGIVIGSLILSVTAGGFLCSGGILFADHGIVQNSGTGNSMSAATGCNIFFNGDSNLTSSTGKGIGHSGSDSGSISGNLNLLSCTDGSGIGIYVENAGVFNLNINRISSSGEAYDCISGGTLNLISNYITGTRTVVGTVNEIEAAKGVGILNENFVRIDGTAADTEYAKFTTDGITGQTYAQVRTDLNVADNADVTNAASVDAAGAVMETDFNAYTILAADVDDTPAPLTVGANTIVGRAAAGGIVALTAEQARTILGGLTRTQVIVSTSATYEATPTATNELQILVTYSATGIASIELQTAGCVDGAIVEIKDVGYNAGLYNIAITTEGSELLNGQTDASINSDGGGLKYVAYDGNWHKI